MYIWQNFHYEWKCITITYFITIIKFITIIESIYIIYYDYL